LELILRVLLLLELLLLLWCLGAIFLQVLLVQGAAGVESPID
jgi:hypothetical protein